MRIAQVRKGDDRSMRQGLVWVEAYLPFDPQAFQAFTRKWIACGRSATAVEKADPELARRALTPIDSQGEAMLAEDVQALAHAFITKSRKMDVQHDERARKSLELVESFVNGPEVASPNFWPGAWVVVFRVEKGSQEWADIESGRLDAVSFQGWVTKIPIAANLAQEGR